MPSYSLLLQAWCYQVIVRIDTGFVTVGILGSCTRRYATSASLGIEILSATEMATPELRAFLSLKLRNWAYG